MVKFKHVLALDPYYGGSPITSVFPSTGLEYIVTNMEDLVGDVTFVELSQEEKYRDVDTLSALIRQKMDLVCISIRWRSGFERVCKFISKLPEEVFTVVGGHQATEEVEHLLEVCPNIDVIVRGEGEETIREVVSGVPRSEILGISYRENGGVVHNANRPVPDLASISYPDRSRRKYRYYWRQAGIRMSSLTFDTIMTARGCPYSCKFCTFSLNPLGQKRPYAERPLESVIEELKTITADVVLFSDDNFFTSPSRSERLCDLILENGIKKHFVVQTRIEISRNRRLLDKAARAGFKLFLMGIESPHDKILEQYHKGFTQQQIRDAFEVLNDYDFHIHGYFIYGNIGETEEEMVYIAQFAKELKLDTIGFQKLRIEKYSPLRGLVESTPGYYFDGSGGQLYSTKYDRRELKRIRDRIRVGFYDMKQVLRILAKAHRVGFLRVSDLLRSVYVLPVFLSSLGVRAIRKRLGR